MVDPEDVTKKLATEPDLQGCDTSPCLKRKGQLLGTPFVARVKVDVTGNSYKITARAFRTQGPAPAALPVDTRSRFCDVCTITEVRKVMIRLADNIDLPRDEVVAAPALPPPTPVQTRHVGATIGLCAGLAAIAAGAILLATSDQYASRTQALGGGLMGAGAVGAIVGVYGNRTYTSLPASKAAFAIR